MGAEAHSGLAGGAPYGNLVSRYTNDWQEDRAVAAGGLGNQVRRGRKVRTPQGSVPDNVRDAGFKARGRPVPQKRYRLGYPSTLQPRATLEPPEGFAWTDESQRRGKGEKVRQERTAPAVTPGAG